MFSLSRSPSLFIFLYLFRSLRSDTGCVMVYRIGNNKNNNNNNENSGSVNKFQNEIKDIIYAMRTVARTFLYTSEPVLFFAILCPRRHNENHRASPLNDEREHTHPSTYYNTNTA